MASRLHSRFHTRTFHHHAMASEIDKISFFSVHRLYHRGEKETQHTTTVRGCTQEQTAWPPTSSGNHAEHGASGIHSFNKSMLVFLRRLCAYNAKWLAYVWLEQWRRAQRKTIQ